MENYLIKLPILKTELQELLDKRDNYPYIPVKSTKDIDDYNKSYNNNKSDTDRINYLVNFCTIDESDENEEGEFVIKITINKNNIIKILDYIIQLPEFNSRLVENISKKLDLN